MLKSLNSKNTASFFSRLLSAGLAIVFVAQTTFAYVPEKNFWEERTRNKASRNEDSFQLASLTTTQPLTSAISTQTKALKEMGTVGPIKSSLKSSPFLPKELLPFVRIRDFQIVPGKPVVYLLEDVHMNEEAQRNSSSAMRVLLETQKQNDLMIGVEGSVGQFDFSAYHSLPRQEVVKQIADEFLKDARIGAASYTGLTVNSVKAIGLENPQVYSANVEAYRTAMNRHESIQNALLSLEADNQQIASKVLRQSLLSFLQDRNRYEAGSLSLGEYGQQLIGNSKTADAPLHLQTFLEAYQLEKTLDFSRVEHERKSLFEKLARDMSENEIAELIARSLSLKASHLNLAEYYQEIKTLLANKGVDLKSYPAFESYLQYVFLSDSIKVERLFSDIKVLEVITIRSLHPTEKEQAILDQAHAIALTKKLVGFSLTPEEWRDYSKTRLANLGGGHLDLSPFEAFYEIAEKRNQSLVENLGHPRSAVVIAGGFHTGGLKELFLKRGFSFVVLTPHITKIDSSKGSEYLRVFLREKSPLEKLFAGRKLFLALPEGIGPVNDQPVVVPLRQLARELFFEKYNALTGAPTNRSSRIWRSIKRLSGEIGWAGVWASAWGVALYAHYQWGTFIPLFIVSIFFFSTLHELAHAWIQFLLGDSTPKKHGRLSIDPRRHWQILGEGWVRWLAAKPVPFNEQKPRVGAVVAGPFTNLAIGVLALSANAFAMPSDVLWLIGTINLIQGLWNLTTLDGIMALRLGLGLNPNTGPPLLQTWKRLLAPFSLSMEPETPDPSQQSPELTQAIKTYKRATVDLFKAATNLNAEQFREAGQTLITSARWITSHAPSQEAIDAHLTTLNRKRKVRQSDGTSFELPELNAEEIINIGGDPNGLTEHMRQAVQEQLELFINSFPEDQQEDVKRFQDTIEFVATNGEDLVAPERIAALIEDAAGRPDDQEELGDAVLRNLAHVFEVAREGRFPDFVRQDLPTLRVVLKPRNNKKGLDLLAVIAMHEIAHGLAQRKALDIPSGSEVFTEAVTMAEVLRKLGDSEEVFNGVGKQGAGVLLAAAKDWVKARRPEEDNGPEAVIAMAHEAMEAVLNEWPQFGFKSLEEALYGIRRPEFVERQTGLFLGAVMSLRYSDTALQNLIQYANTTLAALTQNHIDAVVADPKQEQRLVRELQREVQALAGLERLEVRPWKARSASDVPQWRFTPAPFGSRKPAILEYPRHDIFNPDEELTRLRGLVQGLIAVEAQRITVESDVAANAGFLLLLASVYLARAEKSIVHERPGLQSVYDRLKALFYPNPKSPAAKARFEKLPAYLQYLEAMLYEARTGKPDPRLEDATVVQSLEKTKETRNSILDSQKLKAQAEQSLVRQSGFRRPAQKQIVAEQTRLIYRKVKDELWPELQALYQKSEQEALAQEVLEKAEKEQSLNELMERLQQLEALVAIVLPDEITADLEELLKELNDEERQQVVQELEKEAQKLPDNQREQLEQQAKGDLKESEQQVAEDLGQAGQHAQKTIQKDQHEIDRQLERLDLKEKLEQASQEAQDLKEQVPDISKTAQELQDLATGIKKMAADAASEEKTEYKSGATQALEQMARQLLEQAQALKEKIDKAEASAESLQEKAAELGEEPSPPVASELSEGSEELDKAIEQMAQAAKAAQEAGQALEEAARALQESAEGGEAAEGRAKTQGMAQGGQEVADEADGVQGQLKQLEQALAKIQKAIEESQKLVDQPGQGDGEGSEEEGESQPASSIKGLKGRPSKKPSKSRGPSGPSDPFETPAPDIPSDLLADLHALGGRTRLTETSPDSEKRRELEQEAEMAARMGFSLEDWQWWQAFLKPVNPVVQTLTDLFLTKLEEKLIKKSMSGLLSGHRLAPHNIHRVFTDAKVFERTIAPGKITLLLMLLADASGSMGPFDNSQSKFYQTAQAFTALAMSFLGVREESRSKTLVDLDVEVRAYAEDDNISIHPFGAEFTQRSLFDAIMKFMRIRGRDATADVPTFRAGARELVKHAEGKPRSGVGLINTTDGNEEENAPRIAEIYNDAANSKIEFLSVGVGEGAHVVEKVYGSKTHRNVRALHVPNAEQLRHTIVKQAVDMFERMIEKADMSDLSAPFLLLLSLPLAFYSVPFFLFIVATIVFAITWHEWGHARVQIWLGDSTPLKEGRLSLNPFRHFQITWLGWFPLPTAKPVNFNARQPHVRSLLAGPAVNLLIAALAFTLNQTALDSTLLLWVAGINLIVALWNLATLDGMMAVHLIYKRLQGAPINFSSVFPRFQWLVPFTQSMAPANKVYDIKDIGGNPHFVMWDRWGQEVSLPIRRDTTKLTLKSDVHWQLERHKVTATQPITGVRIEGHWLGTRWAWFEQDSNGVIHGLAQGPPSWLNIKFDNENLEVQTATAHLLFTGKRANGFWEWEAEQGQKAEEDLESRVPHITPVERNGQVLPDVVELNIKGQRRRIKLTPSFADKLVQMMMILRNPDPASTNLALTGHKSTGKNTAVYVLAGFLKQPIRTLSLHAHTMEDDLLWRMTVGLFKAGSTERFLGEYTDSARLGDWIAVDEATKIEQPGVLTSLNTINQSRWVRLPDGSEFKVPGTFRPFFLWNPPGGIYRGQDLSKVSDFLSRLRGVPFSYPSKEEEADLLMETVFGGDPDNIRDSYKPVVAAMTGIAEAIRTYADSPAGEAARIPPVDTRQLQRTLRHIRQFPKDLPFLREIFLLDYPLSAIPDMDRDQFTKQLERWFDDFFGKGKFASRFYDNNGKALVDPGWPRVDDNRRVVIFGNNEVGEFELPMGDLLLDKVEVKEFLDIPTNRIMLWCLAKDLKMGFDNVLLGEKGTGKTEMVLFLLKGLLRWDLEQPPQITEGTRGDDILGMQEIQDGRSHFPEPPLQRAMQTGRRIFFDEIAKSGPDVLATLHNAAEYRLATFTSGKEVSAKPGFGLTLAGNLAAGHVQAHSFSAEFGSRFRTYWMRPLNQQELENLITKDAQRLQAKVTGAGRAWAPIEPETITALARTFMNLLDVHRRLELRVPPDYRQIHSIIQTLGQFPLSSLGIEDELVNAMIITRPEGRLAARAAMTPLGSIRLTLAARHFGSRQDLPLELCNAVAQTMGHLVQATSQKEFPFVPTNEQLQAVLQKIGPAIFEFPNQEQTADLIAQALGVSDSGPRRKIREAVQASKLDEQMRKIARTSAVTKVHADLDEAMTASPIDQELLVALKKLADDLVDMAASKTLTKLVTKEQLAKMVEAFVPASLEKSRDARATICAVLGISDSSLVKKIGESCKTSGLQDRVIALIFQKVQAELASITGMDARLNDPLKNLVEGLTTLAKDQTILMVTTDELKAIAQSLASDTLRRSRDVNEKITSILKVTDPGQANKLKGAVDRSGLQARVNEVADELLNNEQALYAADVNGALSHPMDDRLREPMRTFLNGLVGLRKDNHIEELPTPEKLDALVRILPTRLLSAIYSEDGKPAPLFGLTNGTEAFEKVFQESGLKDVLKAMTKEKLWAEFVYEWHSAPHGRQQEQWKALGQVLNALEEGTSAVGNALDGFVRLFPSLRPLLQSLVSSLPQSHIKEIDIDRLKREDIAPTTTKKMGFKVISVAYSPDGQWMAIGQSQDSSSSSIELYDRRTGERKAVLEGHRGAVWGLSFSPDSKTLLSGAVDQTVRLWDVTSQKELRKFDNHSNKVKAAAFSPDGKFAASGSEDTTVRIWDVEKKEEFASMQGHGRSTEKVAFSPDSKLIFSASSDKTVRIWDVQQKKQLGDTLDHDGGVWSLAISADGKTLVTGTGGPSILFLVGIASRHQAAINNSAC